MEKIRTTFGQQIEVKGQKRAFWAKFFNFCVIFTVKATVYALELVLLFLFQPSVMYYPLRKNPNNFLDGMKRSKV